MIDNSASKFKDITYQPLIYNESNKVILAGNEIVLDDISYYKNVGIYVYIECVSGLIDVIIEASEGTKTIRLDDSKVWYYNFGLVRCPKFRIVAVNDSVVTIFIEK